MRFEQRTDGPPVEAAITLGSRGPHRRPLAPVEHAELERGHIRRPSHDTAERVHFADNGALRHAADRGVTRHLADGFQRTRHECCPRSSTSGGDGRLSSRMPTADDEDLELRFKRCGKRHTER